MVSITCVCEWLDQVLVLVVEASKAVQDASVRLFILSKGSLAASTQKTITHAHKEEKSRD